MNFKLFIIIIFSMIFLFGCKGSNQLTNVNGIETTTTTTTSSPVNSCVDNTIDVGVKGVSATNPRGTFSDVATIPGTNNYATAYFDVGTSTIKISYWDGTSFSHEVVAGDHLATYMRIVFLSSGIPLVFWTNGSTTVKMASRGTAFGTSGSWTMGIIDTVAGMASRAINVSVNPLDEVGVVYLTNTTVAAAPRFVVCSTSCSNAANYTAMTSSTMNIETSTTPAAAITGQVSIGMSWCQGSAGEYYPAVAYGAANTVSQSRYAVCTQADISNCLVNTNWNKTTFSATNNISSSLYIDATVINDTPKIASVTAGIRTYEGTVGCSAPGAWTAGSAILTGTSATDGNAWLRLLKSKSTPQSTANERYHIIANASTTSMRYYNTSSNAFNTFASWNSVGVLQTTTLLAASATSGGATILTTNNELVATHYSSVAPQNLVASVIRNLTQGSSAATVDLIYPNTRGNLQLIGGTANSTTAARNISVSATTEGYPGVAYIDSSNGTHLTGRLKYAFRESLLKNTTWSFVTVPFSGVGPMYPSLKYDHLNRPWISYYDFNSTAANSRFYLMTNSNSSGTGVWKVYQFPHAGTAAAVALSATNNTALGMYFSGNISYPVMAAIENNTTRVVKASRFNPVTETWSAAAAVTVDTLSASGAANLVMDNDDNGNIVLAWVDLATAAPFAGVEYSYSNGGLSWTAAKRVQSDSTTVQKIGQGISISLNPVNGYPAITYYDRSANKVYYSTCANTPLNCSVSVWSNTEIESNAGVNGVTTYIGGGATSTRDQLLSTALSYDSDGNAAILYSSGNGALVGGAGGNLNRINISSTNIQTTEIFKSGVNASGSITGVNMAVSGHNVDSIQTSNDELVSVFIDAGNVLQARSCGEE
jgi:hypothetical protein